MNDQALPTVTVRGEFVIRDPQGNIKGKGCFEKEVTPEQAKELTDSIQVKKED